jgi:glycosyltransferase involved in cell wall biosynthesis
MRIGIDCRFYSSSFTGIGRYTYELVKNLLKIDKKNEYVLFFNEQEYSSFCHSCPESLRDRNLKNCKAILVNAKHYSLEEQTIFLKKLYEAKLDLMHFTHFNAPILYRKPCVVTIHDLTPSFYPGKKFNKLHYKLAYNLILSSIIKRSKKIIAVSKHSKNDTLKSFPKTKEKIKVIYESVAEEFLKNPKEKKLNRSKDYILYTGVWRNHKNLLGLIQAFAKLIKEKKLNANLVITGKEDPYYPEIKTTISELKLEKSVILTGLVSEQKLISLYHNAKLYVFPSFYEGFGLPILESFASKIPLVCSNASSIPEIAGKNNAVFFDPYNIDDMAEKILQVWNDENLQKKLIENGEKRLKNFSWEKMAKETLKIYESIKT